jgi:general secretion pathway protein H
MGGRRRTRAFTLVELLVVLALLAVSLAVIVPNISGSLATAQAKSATRAVLSALRLARTRAIARQEETTVEFDLDARSYRIAPDGRIRHLPDHLELALVAAQSEQSGDRRAGITFFPDGSSTGGRVSLTTDARDYVVDVDWLTGVADVLD